MKLSLMMTSLISKLNSSSIDFTQVESYEGQFEDLNNFIVMPPAIFVDFASGGKSQKRDFNSGVDVAMYLCTESLHDNPQNTTMLNAIDTISEEIERYRGLTNHAISYRGFQKIGNFPGFKIYQLNFRID